MEQPFLSVHFNQSNKSFQHLTMFLLRFVFFTVDAVSSALLGPSEMGDAPGMEQNKPTPNLSHDWSILTDKNTR